MKKFLKPTLLSLALASSAVTMANIPEPNAVFYGKVTAKVGSTAVMLTEGEMTWEIRSRDDSSSHVFEVVLEPLADGRYSYKLEIPQQLSVDIDTLLPEVVKSLSIEDQQELFLRHYNITINGKKAILKDESLAVFASSQQNRASSVQLDLEVSADALGDELDKNGNGIPDAWENHYNISDISADDDGDGWTNEEEYANGTDPTVNNRVPLMVSESLAEDGTVELRVFEGGIS